MKARNKSLKVKAKYQGPEDDHLARYVERLRDLKRDEKIMAVIAGVDMHWPGVLEEGGKILCNMEQDRLLPWEAFSTLEGDNADAVWQETFLALEGMDSELPHSRFELDEAITDKQIAFGTVALIVGYTAGLRKARISREVTARALKNFLRHFPEKINEKYKARIRALDKAAT